MDVTRQPGIRIGQIFLERAEFSHRDDALQIPPSEPFQPNLSVKIQGAVAPDEQTGFVRIIVKTKPEEKPLYNLDLSLMALLEVDKDQRNLSLKDYVRGAGPVMLFPFLREAVAGLTGRGRFGPIWVGPFNMTTALGSDSPTGEATTGNATPKIERPSRTLKKRPRSKAKA